MRADRCIGDEPQRCGTLDDLRVGFADGFVCSDAQNLTLCLFGTRLPVDCTDFGYTRCVDDGFCQLRCTF